MARDAHEQNATPMVTSHLYKPGDVDETAYGKFLAKMVKYYRRCRDKRHHFYTDWTDAQCQEAAEFYCRSYRHQFRVLVSVER